MSPIRSTLAIIAASLCAASCMAQQATLPYKFTLSASGEPLTLGRHADSRWSFHPVSTLATVPENDFPYLTLTNKVLNAFPANGRGTAGAVDIAGAGSLTFLSSDNPDTGALAPIYTAVSTPRGANLILAANGVSDKWSLCRFKPHGQVNVVFNAADVPANPPTGIEKETCKSVVVSLVPV